MKVNIDLKMHLESCYDWEYRKLLNFIPECGNVWIENYPRPSTIEHIKLNPYQNMGMLVVIHLQSLARRSKIST